MKCKVCGMRFTPNAEKRYLATERLAPLASLTTAAKVYECFDCPRCGCQNFVNIRMPKYEVKTDDREEIEEEEEAEQ